MDLCDAFQAAGFRSIGCQTGQEAREVLDQETVGLLILDVMLPDIDGVEFLEEIRNLPKCNDAVVMMLSGETEVKDRIRGMRAGADEYIGKPYDTSYVISRAQELRQARMSKVGLTPTVLIIDDSVTFREELGTTLAQAGYSVISADSA